MLHHVIDDRREAVIGRLLGEGHAHDTVEEVLLEGTFKGGSKTLVTDSHATNLGGTEEHHGRHLPVY